MLKLVLFLNLIVSLNYVLASKGNDCHLRKYDQCLAEVEQLSNDPSTLDSFKTESGLTNICNTVKRANSCLDDYLKKCGTLTHREIYEFFGGHFRFSVNSACEDANNRAKFLNQIQCVVDKVLKQEDYKSKCVNSFLATLDTLKAQTETSVKYDTACCSYNRWESCMYTLIKQTCNIDTRKAFEDFIVQILGASTRRLCNPATYKYTSKKCTNLYAPPDAVSKGKYSDNPITKYIANYIGFLFN